MTREPLVTVASISATVAAVIALVVAFGVDLTQDQTSAILGVVGVLAPLLVALATHGKVTPVADPKDDTGRALVPEHPMV